MTSSTVSDSAVDSSAGVRAASHEGGESAGVPSGERAVSTDGAAPASTRAAAPTAAAPPTVAVAPAAASAPRTSRTMSILALSLGIASLIFAQSVVVPLAAVILGVFGLRDEPAGRSFSIWGIVLACVAAFGWVVVVAAGALISLPFLFLAAF